MSCPGEANRFTPLLSSYAVFLPSSSLLLFQALIWALPVASLPLFFLFCFFGPYLAIPRAYLGSMLGRSQS